MSIQEDLDIILEFAEDRPNSLIRKGKTLLSYTKTQKKKFEYNSEEHIEALKIKLTKGRNKTNLRRFKK